MDDGEDYDDDDDDDDDNDDDEEDGNLLTGTILHEQDRMQTGKREHAYPTCI